MGIHFDALVEIVRKISPDETADIEDPRIRRIGPYLENLVRNAALFELPVTNDVLMPEKNNEEYGKYFRDYCMLSQQYNKFMITPFEITAIEDPSSVVIFEHQEGSKYLVTTCGTNSKKNAQALLACGLVEILPPGEKNGWRAAISPVYSAELINGSRQPTAPKNPLNFLVENLSTAANAYTMELTYIMDPENFIIRKEHKDSRLFVSRNRKPNMLRKTIMRPHYVCIEEDTVCKIGKGKSEEPQPLHPVRGHWKTLMSEKFTRKRGQRIYVRQYFTGAGKWEGPQGWTYEIMVKDAPDRIVAYEE